MTTFEDSPYSHSEAEYNELWRLLVEVNGRSRAPDVWSFARLENWRYASHDRPDEEFRDMAHLWRNEAGRLAGFTIVEHLDDELSLQTQPEYRAVEADMLAWGEARYRGERPSLGVLCRAGDAERATLLAGRGYRDLGPAENQRAYDLTRPWPSEPLPPGYRLADLAEFTDYPAYIALERLAFNNDYLDEKWFWGKASSPSYRFDLHVVALAPDGSPAALALGWAESDYATAEIDPIATHPDHRRKGLARAVTVEAFRRLAARGARTVWIGSGPEPNPSNRVYDGLGPSGKWAVRRWEKELS